MDINDIITLIGTPRKLDLETSELIGMPVYSIEHEYRRDFALVRVGKEFLRDLPKDDNTAAWRMLLRKCKQHWKRHLQYALEIWKHRQSILEFDLSLPDWVISRVGDAEARFVHVIPSKHVPDFEVQGNGYVLMQSSTYNADALDKLAEEAIRKIKETCNGKM